MLNSNPRLARLFVVPALALSSALPAFGQLEILRRGDDQFIQGLREQGMSDLLDRFVESDPPEDPIARLALDVALKEFVASDLLARATRASQEQDFTEANNLFQQSRSTFEELLGAQRKMIADHGEDERMPLWQADFAEMLLDRYLPRYFQNVGWHYEFGEPSDEQRAAFESAMVEALQVTVDSNFRLERLLNRVGAEEGLNEKLEEMGIKFRLEDYRKINTPYWLAHAAHGVSLLPKDHSYYKTKSVRNQRNSVQDEKKRLRDLVLDALSGSLASDERTKLTAKLLSGQTLVWSDDVDDIDEGVETYLEEVINDAADSRQGYIATLAKAIGRWRGGEMDLAMTILGGMERNPYVRADPTIVPRLLAADLMFRIQMEEAEKKLPGERPPLIAKAYETSYIPLLAGDQDPRYKQMLFTRWAASVADDSDPMDYPATVRMGIGEQLTNLGGNEAQIVMQILGGPKPTIPAELEQWQADVKQRSENATKQLERAALFNETLTGEDMEPGPLLSRGLYNLASNKYWLASMTQALNGTPDWRPFFEAARVWLSVGQRTPEAEQAQESVVFAISLLLGQDMFHNKEGIGQKEVRDAYKAAFDLMNERWSTTEACHNNRVYAAFNLYEKVGDLQTAIEVYRELPNTHTDYYQARRQMIYAMHRLYRSQADRLRLMLATQPPEFPAVNATQEEKDALKKAQDTWAIEHDQLQENITRERDGIVEESELVILDAADEVENGPTPARRFTAATALGAAKVVLAGMLADEGKAKDALKMLEGFEASYAPTGKYAQLATLQSNPDAAKATLQGLEQSAQEQRIITLLEAGQTDEMAAQAQVMMNNSPDVAAAVVNGVLRRIGAMIDREERAVREAAFESQAEQARGKVKFLAGAAVALSELLVQWAEGRDFGEKKEERMVAYKMPLAEALMLAGRGEDALSIMLPILEKFPNNFSISLRTGKAYLSLYKQKQSIDRFNGAMSQFSKVIKFYNQRVEKPDNFWDAWLHVCLLLEAAGGDQAAKIPERARILKRVDENLGGPAFKDRFIEVFKRNGGVEQLEVQPAP